MIKDEKGWNNIAHPMYLYAFVYVGIELISVTLIQLSAMGSFIALYLKRLFKLIVEVILCLR